MRLFKIEENDANQRLDKFLKKLFPRATRSLIYKFNRKDKIKIKFDGSEGKFRKRDNEYKLQIWDEMRIFLSDSEFYELSSSVEEKTQFIKEKLDKKDIVFEDGDLFVINKNSWMNVHAWDHKTKEINVIVQVQDYLWDKLNSLTFKPSLIHRIDRDTSGILMIGKKKDILSKLVGDFKTSPSPSKGGGQIWGGSHWIQKTYYAIVLWKLSRKEWTITKKLLRIEWAQNENKVQVSEKGQTAVSHYKLLGEHILKAPEWNIILSEVEVQIETGRMHQIRVHMASIGNPIVWDKAYGDKRMNSYLERNFWLRRQALHAWKIEFFHYGRNKKMKLEARIKKDLVDFLENVRTSPSPSKGGG